MVIRRFAVWTILTRSCPSRGQHVFKALSLQGSPTLQTSLGFVADFKEFHGDTLR